MLIKIEYSNKSEFVNFYSNVYMFAQVFFVYNNIIIHLFSLWHYFLEVDMIFLIGLLTK